MGSASTEKGTSWHTTVSSTAAMEKIKQKQILERIPESHLSRMAANV
jgi:hypothetical protein